MSRRMIAGLPLTVPLTELVTVMVMVLVMAPIAVGCSSTPVQQDRSQNAGLRETAHAVPAPTPVPTMVTSSPAGTKQSYVSLPMRVVNSDGGTLLYVPMRVNGKGPYEFVLDTGSSNSSVDRSLVRRLSLPHTGQSHPVQGVTGSGVVPVVRVRRWSLGGLRMHAKTLSVVDLGMNVAGLLGSDELRRFGDVTLDFQHRRLLIHYR